jgi:hypothetical protein
MKLQDQLLGIGTAALVCVGCLLATSASGQETLFRWTLDQPELQHWRKKENCTLAAVPQPDGGLRWSTAFGPFDFGWTSYFPPTPLDLTRAGRVTFAVKGDGSGHLLTLQLGHAEPGVRSHYYVNKADGVRLDFTDWREVSFELARFAPPAGRDPHADLKQVAFIEFFLNRVGENAAAEALLDDVRVLSASPAQAEATAALWDSYAQLARQEPATDGSNVLPNASFENDLEGDGQPDFWRGSDWGTGSTAVADPAVAHTGQASLRIDCASDEQRGSFSFRPTVGPGPWIFEGWYRTGAMQAESRKGPVARLIAVDEQGAQCGVFQAYGQPSDGAWQQAVLSFDLPAGATRINLDLFNFFAAGSVWWDDVSLRFDVAEVARRAERRRREAECAEQAMAMIDGVTQAVAQLPAETAADKLKKAALEWAVEDARASLEAGFGISAQEVLGDVQRLLGEDIGRRAEPSDRLLLPVRDFEKNPYAQGLLGRVRSVLQTNTLYQKGDAGYRQIENAWTFRSLGDNAYVAAWGLCCADSPYAASPELLVRMLRLMQAIFQNHRGGDFNPERQAVHGYDPNINRFCFVPAFEAYLLLDATYPGLILPSKRAEWRASAEVATEYQIETYGERASLPPPHCYYANMDVHYMLMLELAARIFDVERYHQEAERFCQLTADQLYPDGAFAYHGFQNECYVYHQINVAHLVRYWQLTGSELAHETVVRSRPYYPYNVEPGGVPEYYTDCFWKHYWSGISSIGPDLVAGLTGCAHNRRIAQDELRWETPNHYYAIYAAALYRPEIEDQPLPDNHLIYDRNVEGPRGRFGRWSFAGTTRLFGDGSQGKDTFVGGMVVDEPTRRHPLNAALQVVTSQYRLEPRTDGDGNCRRWRECRYLSQDERNAVTIGTDFAALTTRYRIQNVAWGGKSTLTDWAGNQQWLLTPQRLVGVLEIEPLSDQQAYSIHGRIRFGMNKEFERRSATEFRYGSLVCRLHEHNYADAITERSETFYIDTPEKFRSREIVLRDQASIDSGEQQPLTYPQGTRQFFTVEVLPDWCAPADSVRRIATPDGLRGLEVNASGHWLLLVHNPTEAALKFQASLPWATGNLTLHSDGGQQTVQNAGDQLGFDIPPHGHRVLEKAP